MPHKSFAGRVKSAARKRAAPATARIAAKTPAEVAPPKRTSVDTLRTETEPKLPATATPPSIKPQADPDPGFVAVGRVLGPFGLKGELKVQTLTDNDARFRPKARLYAGEQLVTVAKSREAQGHLYVTLKGFPDRDSVDRFRHALLQVPESDLPPLPEGEYYRYQLIGLTVVTNEGTVLGTLDEIIETGANDVYRVHPPEGADVLLPALANVVLSVDLATKRMVVDPPDWR